MEAPYPNIVHSSNTLLRLAWKRYQRNLKRHPVRTNALTSAGIFACSDIIAQQLVPRKGGHDWLRTMWLAIYGGAFAGPVGYWWQRLLDKLFQHRTPGPRTALQKMAVHQLTFGPFANVAFLLFSAIVLDRNPMSSAAAGLKQSFIRVQANSWRVWPLASFISYSYIPQHLRVVFFNLVALFWGVMLLLLSSSASRK